MSTENTVTAWVDTVFFNYIFLLIIWVFFPITQGLFDFIYVHSNMTISTAFSHSLLMLMCYSYQYPVLKDPRFTSVFYLNFDFHKKIELGETDWKAGQGGLLGGALGLV